MTRSLDRRRGPARRPRLAVTPLESRLTPTATLYVDFGDAFPNGSLTGATVFDFITKTTGPTDEPFDNPAGALQLDSFASIYGTGPAAAQVRADVMTLVRRYFEPFDVTVVDLGAAPQDVNGHTVQPAASLDDAAATLAANDADPKPHDAYVFVSRFLIDGVNAFPAGGGLASNLDVYGYNSFDGSAAVGLADAPALGAFALGQEVVREAGRLFGLLDVYRSPPGSGPVVNIPGTATDAEVLYRSEGMSGSEDPAGFGAFLRYPTIAAYPLGNIDDQNPGAIDYNTLSGFQADSTAWQLLTDGEVGPGGTEYVTGTGAHDIITITRGVEGEGVVAVQAFTSPAYTPGSAIPVPGGGGTTTYTYTIDLSKPLTIDAGAGDDRIVLAADLGTAITVRGMQGTDSLVVVGDGTGSATYTPGTNTASGLDGNPDFRGTVTAGATTINFQEFDPASRVTINAVPTVTLVGTDADDAFTVAGAGGTVQATGTVAGVPFVPLTVPAATALAIAAAGGTDTLTGDNAGRTYTITGPGAGTVSGLVTGGFSGVENLVGGTGADTFTFTGGSLDGTITGGGTVAVDTLTGDAAGRTFTLTGLGTGTVSTVLVKGFTGIERLVGGTGNDTLVGDDNPETFALTARNAGTVGLLANGFSGMENLTGGLADDTFAFQANGSVSGNIDGRGGVDRLNFGLLGSQDVTLTATGPVDGFNGFTFGTSPIGGVFFNVDTITGSTAGLTDKLRGLNAAATWQVKVGAGQTYFQDDATGRRLPFTNFEQLTGGNQADRFTVDFSAGPPIPVGGLTVNGGLGTDFLGAVGSAARDYFTLGTAALWVNGRAVRYAAVETLEAHGGDGADTFTSTATTLFGPLQLVRFYGEGGNDTAVVTPTTNVPLFLDGGAGFDTLRVQRQGGLYALPLPPKGATSGTFFFSNRQRIDFLSWESQDIGAAQYRP